MQAPHVHSILTSLFGAKTVKAVSPFLTRLESDVTVATPALKELTSETEVSMSLMVSYCAATQVKTARIATLRNIIAIGMQLQTSGTTFKRRAARWAVKMAGDTLSTTASAQQPHMLPDASSCSAALLPRGLHVISG